MTTSIEALKSYENPSLGEVFCLIYNRILSLLKSINLEKKIAEGGEWGKNAKIKELTYVYSTREKFHFLRKKNSIKHFLKRNDTVSRLRQNYNMNEYFSYFLK